MAAVLAVLLVAGLAVGRWGWDRGHTYTAGQLTAALETFRPPGSTFFETTRSAAPDAAATDQPACRELLDQTGDVLDRVFWGPSFGNRERGAITAARYAHPAGARREMRTLEGLSQTCPTATLGTTWDISPRPRSWSSRLSGQPLRWELTPSSVDQSLPRLIIAAVGYGNVVFFYSTEFSGPEQSDADRTQVVKELERSLRDVG